MQNTEQGQSHNTSRLAFGIHDRTLQSVSTKTRSPRCAHRSRANGICDCAALIPVGDVVVLMTLHVVWLKKGPKRQSATLVEQSRYRKWTASEKTYSCGWSLLAVSVHGAWRVLVRGWHGTEHRLRRACGSASRTTIRDSQNSRWQRWSDAWKHAFQHQTR